MLARGWSDEETKDLMGRNLLRVMEEVEVVRDSLSQQEPSPAVWEKRTDLPALNWGGPNEAYFPYEVRTAVAKLNIRHDEL